MRCHSGLAIRIFQFSTFALKSETLYPVSNVFGCRCTGIKVRPIVVNIEDGVLEVHDNANHQETTAQINGDLQAASLMIQTTTFCLGDKSQMLSTTIRWQASTIHNVKLMFL